MPLINEKTGKPFQANSDGIEIDNANGYLYYQALVGRTLYRIKLADLENAKLSDAEVGRGGGIGAPLQTLQKMAHRTNMISFTTFINTSTDPLGQESSELFVLREAARRKRPC